MSLPSITNIDGGSIYVSGGANFALPGVTGFTNTSGGSTFQATGAGSVIDLRNVTSIVGSTLPYGSQAIRAIDGGSVALDVALIGNAAPTQQRAAPLLQSCVSQ